MSRDPDQSAIPPAPWRCSDQAGAGLLDLLQLVDSALPVGGFSHSFGLETAIERGDVADARSLSGLLVAQLEESFGRVDLAGLVLALRRARAADLLGVLDLDARLAALKLAREPREASRAIGRRLLALAVIWPTDDLTERLRAAIAAGETPGHQAIALGCLGAGLGLAARSLALGFAHQHVVQQVSVAVRLLPLGQTDGQRVIHGLKSAVVRAVDLAVDLAPDDLGGFLPQLELASLLHERAAGRLFIS